MPADLVKEKLPLSIASSLDCKSFFPPKENEPVPPFEPCPNETCLFCPTFGNRLFTPDIFPILTIVSFYFFLQTNKVCDDTINFKGLKKCYKPLLIYIIIITFFDIISSG